MSQGYLYRIKILTRDRALIFWTLIFPMLLALFFNVALRSVYSEHQVSEVSMGIVVEDESARSFLDALETQYGLIHQTHFETMDAAKNALMAGAVSGIIMYDSGFVLSFAKSSYNSEITVISNVIENYNMKQGLIASMYQKNPASIDHAFLDNLMSDTNYVETLATNVKSEDLAMIHFFTTISMLCLYSADWGNKSGQYLQADLSAVGIRNNMTPRRKSRLLLMDMAAVYTIFFVEFLIHIVYLQFILNVSLGNNIGLVLVTGLAGGLLSTMLGYMICVSITGSAGTRSTIISMVGLFMSFLSGMMAPSIKYMLNNISPIFSKINPASLITDNFYWIYRGSNFDSVYQNIIIMLILSLIIGVFAFRRLKVVAYDHL